MYYARRNYYGSATAIGFLNTWTVEAFETRRERDAYVEAHASGNRSIRAVTYREALTYDVDVATPIGRQFLVDVTAERMQRLAQWGRLGAGEL